MEKFEEKYIDQLRSLELAIVRVYRAQAELVDHQTLTAVNALVRVYTAVSRRRSPPTIKMDAFSQQVFDDVKPVCEGWLGQGPHFNDFRQKVKLKEEEYLSVSEIIACLKRIRKSIKMWQKEGGRQGYYQFINQFLPEQLIDGIRFID